MRGCYLHSFNRMFADPIHTYFVPVPVLGTRSTAEGHCTLPSESNVSLLLYKVQYSHSVLTATSLIASTVWVLAVRQYLYAPPTAHGEDTLQVPSG